MSVRFPDDTNRLLVAGATGSGKSHAIAWHLSNRSYTEMPWVVYNFKGESIFDDIPYVRELGLEDIPSQPGVYVVRPLPRDREAVSDQLWNFWEHQDIGIVVDEGMMIPWRNEAFAAVMTQGRTRGLPVILGTQRPVSITPFAYSESQFFQVFRLQSRKDRYRIEDFIPEESFPTRRVVTPAGREETERLTLNHRLPQYHSWYHDANQNTTTILRPLPLLHEIYATFARRLRPLEERRKKVV